MRPVFAGVVGTVDAERTEAVRRGIEAARIAGRDGDIDLREILRQALVSGCHVLPPSVDLNKPPAVPLTSTRCCPPMGLRGPPTWMRRSRRDWRIDLDVGGAGVLVFVETTFARSGRRRWNGKAALFIGAVGMAEHGGEDSIGIAGSTASAGICWPSRRPR
jgi:hypothetical protein